MLSLSNLQVSVHGQQIINGVDLTLEPGSVHVLMGPNGSGKSSLAYTVAGHPSYTITAGSIIYNGINLNDMSPDERSRLGIFLAFQQPYALPGVSVFTFLKEIYQAWFEKAIPVLKFKEYISELCGVVGLDDSCLERSVNDGFSGGEKKRFELLQMLLLKPKLIFLDEIDSGLDIDGLSTIGQCITHLKKENSKMIVLCITHYHKSVAHIKPNYVHLMQDGKIVTSGDASYADVIEQKGYRALSHDG